MKNCEKIDVHKVKSSWLNIYSIRVPISVPTPFWENETMSTKQITKKEEPLNLNLAEPSEVKSLAFPVSFC